MNVVLGIMKYMMILFMALYTFFCFSVFAQENEAEERRILLGQNILLFLIHGMACFILFMRTAEQKVLVMYIVQAGFLLATLLAYRMLYPTVSRLVVNNMCMLLAIGFVILMRLDMETAQKQMIFAGIGMLVGLVVPVLVRRLSYLAKWEWIFAGVGVGAILLVLLFARASGGALLGFTVFGFGVQPSEFVKILLVFYVAASLSRSLDFRNVLITTAVAATHVLILVFSTDLGAALILFIVYMVMLYVATKQPAYVLAGAVGGSLAAVAGYYLFSHIKVRVAAWQDPFAAYDEGGYQVAQSLFAIGTGGWFGMGLCQGSPDLIPVAESDFVFSAIAEELGLIFSLCLILVCVSCYVMFLNIAMEMRNLFYKLVALGLGTVYVFQVFLSIGGVTKFIPSTGVTLPLVSYGGSSMLSTLIMFGIIQGLYIIREDEVETGQRRRERRRREEVGRNRRAKTQEETGRFEEVSQQRVR